MGHYYAFHFTVIFDVGILIIRMNKAKSYLKYSISCSRNTFECLVNSDAVFHFPTAANSARIVICVSYDILHVF